MPELGPRDKSLIKKIKEHIKNLDENLPSQFVLEDLVKDYNEEYVGSGSEVVVVVHKDKPESGRVIAFNYRDVGVGRAKEVFYLHRLFSTLFPHNFPHFYASVGVDPNSQNKNFSSTVRQRIGNGKLSFFKEKIETKTGFAATRYPFKKVKKICDELGIVVYPDGHRKNFIFGEDGGEYYVDVLQYPNTLEWNTDKILQYMRENQYTEKDIEIAKLSIERLKNLSKISDKK